MRVHQGAESSFITPVSLLQTEIPFKGWMNETWPYAKLNLTEAPGLEPGFIKYLGSKYCGCHADTVQLLCEWNYDCLNIFSRFEQYLLPWNKSNHRGGPMADARW